MLKKYNVVNFVLRTIEIMLLILCLLLSNCAEAARILAVVPSPSYSHQVAFQPIWKELSLRGHEVVTITTDPINDPALVNLTEINLHGAYEIWNKNISTMTTQGFLSSMSLIMQAYFNVMDYTLSHPKVQEIIKNDSRNYDVVLVEPVVFSITAFAERFQAPLVCITSVEVTRELLIAVGNPTHSLMLPSIFLPVHQNLSFKERIYVSLYQILSTIMYSYIFEIDNNNIKKYFGDEYSTAQQLLTNLSLILSNSNPIFHKSKSLLPTVIEIGGGLHRVASKPLPKDLQRILDSAREGFIYFSLGSNVKSVFLSEETRTILLETFAELPYTVLWKFENDNLPNKPNNVFLSKWLPQQDVLRHPNIKLFITQGGLQSIEEATYDYVPMLIMPFFADQQYNAYRMEEKGCALSIDYKTMTKESLKKSILELINNSKYKNRLKELATLVQDQPMSGLAKAIWWIEYVIRHKGTAHLRSPYLDVPTYQYYYLDVIAFFTVVTTVFIYVVFVLVKTMLKQLKILFVSKTKLKVN